MPELKPKEHPFQHVECDLSALPTNWPEGEFYTLWAPEFIKGGWRKPPVVPNGTSTRIPREGEDPFTDRRTIEYLLKGIDSEVGVGFRFTSEHNLISLDIDGGEAAFDRALKLLQVCPTYAEETPSGRENKRIRLYYLVDPALKAELKTKYKCKDEQWEYFGRSNNYNVLTGRRLPEASELLGEISASQLSEYFPIPTAGTQVLERIANLEPDLLHLSAPPLEWLEAMCEILPDGLLADESDWFNFLVAASTHYWHGRPEGERERTLAALEGLCERSPGYVSRDDLADLMDRRDNSAGPQLTWIWLSKVLVDCILSSNINPRVSADALSWALAAYPAAFPEFKLDSKGASLRPPEYKSFIKAVGGILDMGAPTLRNAETQARRRARAYLDGIRQRIVDYFNSAYWLMEIPSAPLAKWIQIGSHETLEMYKLSDVKTFYKQYEADVPFPNLPDIFLSSKSRRMASTIVYIPWEPEHLELGGVSAVNGWLPYPSLPQDYRYDPAQEGLWTPDDLGLFQDQAELIYQYFQRLVGGAAGLPYVGAPVSDSEERQNLTYIFNLFSYYFQTLGMRILPDRSNYTVAKPPVYWNIMGLQGTGKSFLGETFMPKMVGPRLIAFLDASFNFDGQFTSYYAGLPFVYVDEALFSKSPKSNNKIKGLASGKSIIRDTKHVKEMSVPNPSLLITDTNQLDTKSSAIFERRSFDTQPLDFPSEFSAGQSFFGPLANSLSIGQEGERFMSLCLSRRIPLDGLREVPRTSVSIDQQSAGYENDVVSFFVKLCFEASREEGGLTVSKFSETLRSISEAVGATGLVDTSEYLGLLAYKFIGANFVRASKSRESTPYSYAVPKGFASILARFSNYSKGPTLSEGAVFNSLKARGVIVPTVERKSGSKSWTKDIQGISCRYLSFEHDTLRLSSRH